MPSWSLKSNLAALNTARYLVPLERVVSIAYGVEMRVRNGFRLDGRLVIDGCLAVGRMA